MRVGKIDHATMDAGSGYGHGGEGFGGRGPR
jgi:hypothetical protein